MNKKIDGILLVLLFILLIFGLVMIASAGVAYSRTRFGDPYFFFKRQLFGMGIGLALLFIAQKISYQFWKKISLVFFIASLALLVLVFIPGMGTKIYGANRWLQFGPLSFQPSEMLKLSLILYLAAWIEGRGNKIRDFFDGFVPFIAVISIIGFLLIKQPDMGTLGVTILIALSIFFVSGSKLSHLMLMCPTGLVAFLILVKMESYRMDRLLSFIHPELDPKGIGYQVNQALLAIGSGGVLGLGLGNSIQKFNYLPEPVGDSIFAIIGEELGMIGAVILVLLFVSLAIRGFRIASHAPDMFSRLVAVGVVVWFFSQAFINIASISGLIPLTGVPLPFISYGGTSVVFLMIGMGILLNISKHIEEK